jgi:hypothetical protein
LKKLNRTTSLDKTVKELTNRLDEVHPYSVSFDNNHQNRNDGIYYWKGKKIISVKDWNDIYEKSSTYTDGHNILISRKPLQYFPDDYNGSISVSGIVIDELKEEVQNWNKDYFEFLECRKNPILGRIKCRGCLLSGSNDDPIFNGIEKVFARIVSNQCNNAANDHSDGIITYHCNIMNIFSCPFESIKSSNENEEIESKYPYTREDLFALHQISFAIEQAITTFLEITKQNEIIYEIDFENDRVHEIHTRYNGEPESWGWQENVNEQLSKVKPISTIKIRDEQDIYNILTNKEKLEYLIEEYENKNSHRLDNEEEQLCCDENTPCVPDDNNNSNKRMVIDAINCNNANVSHKGENRHSKKIEDKQELDKENIKSDPESKIKEEFEKSFREQMILLKDNKQNIINFLVGNKESIKIEDLKAYEPIYKCYREKDCCFYCNDSTNIICISCSKHRNKEVWVCTNHWKQHARVNHVQ